MRLLVVAVLLLVWGYLLRLLTRAGLTAWRFILGCGGLFLFLVLVCRPLLTGVCARCVCALAGLVGDATHTFSASVPYGVLCVSAKDGSITLLVDFECSGVIEIAGYLSLLAFYQTYDLLERCVIGMAGAAYILSADVIRLTLIAEMVRFLGVNAYYAAHVLAGRILFYCFSTVLYYCTFTKGQVARMKVSEFSYQLKS